MEAVKNEAVKHEYPSKVIVSALLAVALAGCAGAPHHDASLKALSTLQDTAAKAYASGDMTSAVRDYERLTEAVPHDADQWFRLGNAYVRSGRPDDAIGAYQHAVRFDKNLAKAWHNIGIVRLRQAEAALVQGARVSSDGASVHIASSSMADGLAALLRTGSQTTQAPDVEVQPGIPGDEPKANHALISLKETRGGE